MNPRSMLAIGVGGLAAVLAVVFGLARQMGVKSYGSPAGRVVRVGEHFAVLMETCDPYMPSLKGRSESDKSYSYELWLIPESGAGGVRKTSVATSVRSSQRSQFAGVLGAHAGTVWVRASELHGVEVATGKVVQSPPPASIANMPISQFLGPNHDPVLEPYRTCGVRLPSGGWLVLADELEAASDLKAGARLYDNSTSKGSYRDRGLYAVATEPGPIARVATATRVPGVELRNAAFMRAAEQGDVVRFTGPDGVLVVYEAGQPAARTLHIARVNLDGTIAWTADTRLGRLRQVLPHGQLPALVGDFENQLTEPTLVVVRLSDGTLSRQSLKGPLN